MARDRLLAAALPVVAVVALIAVVSAAVWSSARAGTLGFDFLSYDLAVRRFFAGGVLYDQSFDYTGALDRKSTRLNSSHIQKSRMPSSA